jgi:hypothetical protein
MSSGQGSDSREGTKLKGEKLRHNSGVRRGEGSWILVATLEAGLAGLLLEGE